MDETSTQGNELIPSPCACKRMVHKQCLTKWIATRGNRICSICKDRLPSEFTVDPPFLVLQVVRHMRGLHWTGEREYIVSLKNRPAVTIGSGSQCHLALPDPSLSRLHSRIAFQCGSFFVEDLQSSAGTYLRVARRQRVPRASSGDLPSCYKAGRTVFAITSSVIPSDGSLPDLDALSRCNEHASRAEGGADPAAAGGQQAQGSPVAAGGSSGRAGGGRRGGRRADRGAAAATGGAAGGHRSVLHLARSVEGGGDDSGGILLQAGVSNAGARGPARGGITGLDQLGGAGVLGGPMLLRDLVEAHGGSVAGLRMARDGHAAGHGLAGHGPGDLAAGGGDVQEGGRGWNGSLGGPLVDPTEPGLEGRLIGLVDSMRSPRSRRQGGSQGTRDQGTRSPFFAVDGGTRAGADAGGAGGSAAAGSRTLSVGLNRAHRGADPLASADEWGAGLSPAMIQQARAIVGPTGSAMEIRDTAMALAASLHAGEQETRRAPEGAVGASAGSGGATLAGAGEAGAGAVSGPEPAGGAVGGQGGRQRTGSGPQVRPRRGSLRRRQQQLLVGGGATDGTEVEQLPAATLRASATDSGASGAGAGDSGLVGGLEAAGGGSSGQASAREHEQGGVQTVGREDEEGEEEEQSDGARAPCPSGLMASSRGAGIGGRVASSTGSADGSGSRSSSPGGGPGSSSRGGSRMATEATAASSAWVGGIEASFPGGQGQQEDCGPPGSDGPRLSTESPYAGSKQSTRDDDSLLPGSTGRADEPSEAGEGAAPPRGSARRVSVGEHPST